MKKNLRMPERILRTMFGVLLLSWALAGGPYWAFVGLFLIVTAARAYCPIYQLRKLRVEKYNSHIELEKNNNS